MEIMAANRQWSSRPDDERYLSLLDMQAEAHTLRSQSRSLVVSSRRIEARPVDDSHKTLEIYGPNGAGYAPTHWAFGQLAARAGAPAGYLRTLPAEMAADCLNWGFRYSRDIEDIGIYLRRNGESVLAAATGPQYGRIYNSDIIDGLVSRFGDGVTGQWKVPGEFGRPVAVTKANTTLYMSDRDCWVFLADESRAIEVRDRRHGQGGALSRGFFVWNSEVGASTFGVATFLYDYVCCNRIIWGAKEYKEIRIRHTAGAPDRWIEQAEPALIAYAQGSALTIEAGIRQAQAARLEPDQLDGFLAARFGKSKVTIIRDTHVEEEGRPIESLWDAATAATAYARRIPHQDERVKIERLAGEVLDLAA